jgi:hypothetical protein
MRGASTVCLFYQKREKSRECEKDRHNDRSPEEKFFEAAARMEARTKVVAATERPANAGAGLLEEHARDKERRQYDLNVGK